MERYFVQQTELGYIIRDAKRIMPLPFNYISRQYAEIAASKFNEGGSRAVAGEYYTAHVAGKRPLPRDKDGNPIKNPYSKWIKENQWRFE